MEKSNVTDTSEIHKVFGQTVATYLRDNECHIYKSRTGVYLLPEKDRHIFDDITHLARSQKRARKRIIKNAGPNREIPYKPDTPDLDGEDNIRLFDDFRRPLNLSTIHENSDMLCTNPATAQASLPGTSRNTDDNVNLDNNPAKGRNLNIQSYRAHRQFKKINNNEEMFDHLLKIVANIHTECVPNFKPIMESFIKKHRAFKYDIFLDSIPQDKSCLDGFVTQKQLGHFFNEVFYKVVPVTLFGNRGNMRKIQRLLKKFLLAADGEYVTVDKIVHNFNRGCLKWLHIIQDKYIQQSLLLQVTQWFFEQFVWGLISTYFYIEKNVAMKINSFCRRWVKRASTKTYIDDQVRSKTFVPATIREIADNSIPVADLVVYSKEDGVRPILSTVPNPKQKEERKAIKQILRQMYFKYHDTVRPDTIHKIWRSFAENYSNPQETPLYFVSCDIADAYGSIIQEKLLSIIYKILDVLPNYLVSGWFTVLDPKGCSVKDIYKESLAPDSLPVLLPPRTLCCRDTKINKQCTAIDKDHLKKKLEAYILKQKIHVNSQCYVLKQGVGQGLPMSSILCDLYYSDMIVNEFSEFLKSGHLLRYVDDFLYLSRDEESARRFLQKVNESVHAYNCTFKQRKTQSNLAPYNQEEFTYIGYRFNINTLNIVPEYSTIPVRYSISISRPTQNLLNLFVLRIANPKCLKLCSLIMDNSINSQETIFDIVRRASLLSAERCLVLLINMFELEQMDSVKLFCIIKKRCVQPLMIDFKKLIMRNRKSEFKLSWVKLKQLTWSSYFEIFRRNSVISKIFLRLIKSQYKHIF